MRSEFRPMAPLSALEIMDQARGLQAGHGSRLFAHAAEGLRRMMARVTGEGARVPHDAGDAA